MSKEDIEQAIESALNRVEDAMYVLRCAQGDLESIDIDDVLEEQEQSYIFGVPSSAIEGMSMGLRLIEAKYGLSSKEAEEVRKFLTDNK